MKLQSNVESFDSKMPFKFCGLQTPSSASEGTEFFAGAVLTFWLPTLLYCVATRQISPFFFMVVNQALGILIGVLLYEKQTHHSLSCVPRNNIPAEPTQDSGPETKKAA